MDGAWWVSHRVRNANNHLDSERMEGRKEEEEEEEACLTWKILLL